MQVVAFATPTHPEWRWRIVNYSGEVVQESSTSFGTIAVALAMGAQQLQEMNTRDISARPNPYRSTAHLRNR